MLGETGCRLKARRYWSRGKRLQIDQVVGWLQRPSLRRALLPAARPDPDWSALIKTGDPDGGLEWYVRHRNGVEWGWQAKYSFEIDTLLKLMEKSLKTVVAKRPNCRRLTFCVPFDLPDAPGESERKSARQKFEDRKKSWRTRIPGAERVSIELVPAGELTRTAESPSE